MPTYCKMNTKNTSKGKKRINDRKQIAKKSTTIKKNQDTKNKSPDAIEAESVNKLEKTNNTAVHKSIMKQKVKNTKKNATKNVKDKFCDNIDQTISKDLHKNNKNEIKDLSEIEANATNEIDIQKEKNSKNVLNKIVDSIVDKKLSDELDKKIDDYYKKLNTNLVQVDVLEATKNRKNIIDAANIDIKTCNKEHGMKYEKEKNAFDNHKEFEASKNDEHDKLSATKNKKTKQRNVKECKKNDKTYKVKSDVESNKITQKTQYGIKDHEKTNKIKMEKCKSIEENNKINKSPKKTNKRNKVKVDNFIDTKKRKIEENESIDTTVNDSSNVITSLDDVYFNDMLFYPIDVSTVYCPFNYVNENLTDEFCEKIKWENPFLDRPVYITKSQVPEDLFDKYFSEENIKKIHLYLDLQKRLENKKWGKYNTAELCNEKLQEEISREKQEIYNQSKPSNKELQKLTENLRESIINEKDARKAYPSLYQDKQYEGVKIEAFENKKSKLNDKQVNIIYTYETLKDYDRWKDEINRSKNREINEIEQSNKIVKTDFNSFMKNIKNMNNFCSENVIATNIVYNAKETENNCSKQKIFDDKPENTLYNEKKTGNDMFKLNDFVAKKDLNLQVNTDCKRSFEYKNDIAASNLDRDIDITHKKTIQNIFMNSVSSSTKAKENHKDVIVDENSDENPFNECYKQKTSIEKNKKKENTGFEFLNDNIDKKTKITDTNIESIKNDQIYIKCNEDKLNNIVSDETKALEMTDQIKNTNFRNENETKTNIFGSDLPRSNVGTQNNIFSYNKQNQSNDKVDDIKPIQDLKVKTLTNSNIFNFDISKSSTNTQYKDIAASNKQFSIFQSTNNSNHSLNTQKNEFLEIPKFNTIQNERTPANINEFFNQNKLSSNNMQNKNFSLFSNILQQSTQNNQNTILKRSISNDGKQNNTNFTANSYVTMEQTNLQDTLAPSRKRARTRDLNISVQPDQNTRTGNRSISNSFVNNFTERSSNSSLNRMDTYNANNNENRFMFNHASLPQQSSSQIFEPVQNNLCALSNDTRNTENNIQNQNINGLNSYNNNNFLLHKPILQFDITKSNLNNLTAKNTTYNNSNAQLPNIVTEPTQSFFDVQQQKMDHSNFTKNYSAEFYTENQKYLHKNSNNELKLTQSGLQNTFNILNNSTENFLTYNQNTNDNLYNNTFNTHLLNTSANIMNTNNNQFVNNNYFESEKSKSAVVEHKKNLEAQSDSVQNNNIFTLSQYNIAQENDQNNINKQKDFNITHANNNQEFNNFRNEKKDM